MALFAEVVLTGSFTKAADKTGVPLSTISRRIGELEEDVGIQLLQRTTRRLDVTDAGKVFLKHCQEVIQQGYQAKQAIESLKEEPKGHIRMAAPFPPDDSWSAKVISEFLKLYPQITLEHIRSNSVDDMDRLELDVMLVGGERPETNHSVHDIGSIGMMLVASPNYLVEHGIPKEPEDLSEHLFVKFAQLPWNIYAPAPFNQVDIKSRFVTDDGEVARQLVTNGIGLAFIPKSIINRPLECGELIQVLPECEHELKCWMVISRNKQSNRKLIVYLQHIMEHAAQSAPWNFENRTLRF